MKPRASRNVRLSTFARLLFTEWRNLKLPIANEIVVVAVSGGADSTALLLALDELIQSGRLSVTLCVAHLDHGLRSSSRQEAKAVATLARQLGYKPVISHLKVRELARAKSDNLEQAARNERYAFLARTAKRKGARIVLTAHTMDDQAETVLLRLMRGSAPFGLGGMEAIRSLEGSERIQLVRPILWARRSDTEKYCQARKTDFVVDEMNNDESFARVKVRKQLLPLMESFNSKVVEALSRTATMLREDSLVLLGSADDLLSRAIMELEGDPHKPKTSYPLLSVKVLAKASPAVRRRALRKWISEGRGDARRLEMVHLLAVERLLKGTAGGRTVELPGGATVRRRAGYLMFRAEND